MTIASTGSTASAFDQRRAGRELRQLAHEAARPVRDDRFAPVEPAILGDLHLARQDDDQAGRHVAGLDDVLAGGIGAGLAEPAHAIDVGRRQRRKHLVATGADSIGSVDRGFVDWDIAVNDRTSGSRLASRNCRAARRAGVSCPVGLVDAVHKCVDKAQQFAFEIGAAPGR